MIVRKINLTSLPKSCQECPYLDDADAINQFCGLTYDIDPDLWESYYSDAPNDFYLPKDRRLKSCPLMEVEDKEEIDKEEAEYQEWVKNLETVYKDDLGLEFNIVGDMLITDPIFGRGIDLRRAYFKKEEGVWRMEVGE